jgi:glycosyltransferase involved in cell wall biosynthesis
MRSSSLGASAASSALTIVIPALGVREGRLKRAIVSAKPLPIIVVDDATPDRSVEHLANSLEVTYVRRSANGGVSAAQNSGLDAVSTPWVQFLHSDDVYPEEALAMSRPPTCDVVAGSLSREGALSPPALGESPDRFLAHRFGVHISNYQFRTELLNDTRFDERLRAWEDWDLLYRLSRLPLQVSSMALTAGQVCTDAADRLIDSPAMLEGLLYLYEKHDIASQSAHIRAIWEFKIARAHSRQGNRRQCIAWGCRSVSSEPWRPRRVLTLASLARRA